MGDSTIRTTVELRAALQRVSFAPSCVNMGWAWEAEELPRPDGSLKGWLVNTTFQRPDTDSGAVGTGRGRQEFVAVGTSVSGVVKTAWLLAELIVRHELMEAFLFDGNRVFDPHKTVEELSRPSEERLA